MAIRTQRPAIDDTDGDQDPETGEKFPLLKQIGLAGFPYRVGDVQHGLMRRQILGLDVLKPAKDHADDTDEEPDVQDGQPAERTAHESDLGQIRDLDVCLTCESHGGHPKQDDGERTQQRPETAVSAAHDSTLLS